MRSGTRGEGGGRGAPARKTHISGYSPTNVNCQKSANQTLAEKRALCLHGCARSGIQTNGIFMKNSLQKKQAENPRKQILTTAADSVAASWELLGVSPHARICSNHRVDRKVQDWFCQRLASPLALLQHRSQTLSERVCRPCGLKIRNAAELYNFIKRYVTFDRPEGELDDGEQSVEQDDGDDGRRKCHLENLETHSPKLKMNFEETKILNHSLVLRCPLYSVVLELFFFYLLVRQVPFRNS